MAERAISQAEVDAYAELSTDRNPLHVDEEFARNTTFGGTIVHGFLLLGEALSQLQLTTGYAKQLECRFLAPVRPGKSITTVVEPIDDNTATFQVRQGDRLCVTGIIERPRAPHSTTKDKFQP